MKAHKIFVSSNNTKNFKYILDRQIKKVNQVFIQNIKIPISYYNITSGQNEFDLTINNTPYAFVITPGNYDADDIKTELQSRLTALNLLNNPTVSYSQITGKFTFSVNSGSTIQIIKSDISNLIGFTKDSQVSQSVVSDSVANLTHKNIYVLLNNLENEAEIKGRRSHIFYEALIDIPKFGLYTDFNKNGLPIILNKPTTINHIDISLLDEDLGEIDLNNNKYSFELILTYSD